MRIACIQQHTAADVGANVSRGPEALERTAAAGAEVACFAEPAFAPFHPRAPARGEVAHLAHPVSGEITERFAPPHAWGWWWCSTCSSARASAPSTARR